MSKLIRKEHRIMADAETNNNKFWIGELYDNGDVITRWGRVGYDEQSKTFPGKGEKFLETKLREKEKKGYAVARVIEANAPGKAVDVGKSRLAEVAKSQIAQGCPIVSALVDRLAKANVHKITSNTNIQFDPAAGTFSTPMGIITPDAINDARNLLVTMKPFVAAKRYDDRAFLREVSRYLMLVPQNVGMKLNAERLFPDDTSIAKQGDLLDSLEASFNAATKTPSGTKAPDEKVFSVKMTLCDGAEMDRIRRKYRDTRHGYHAASHLDVKQAFLVDMESLRDAFHTNGRGLGNVMQLWHGTRSANLLSILKSGLRLSPPSTAAIAGKMFGNGIYFSDQSTKSLNYAYGYWGGSKEDNCFMFLADVAMGNAFTPRSSAGSGWVPPSGYHSCFAKAGQSSVQNNEMIVYKEHQYNLVRLVEFSPNGR